MRAIGRSFQRATSLGFFSQIQTGVGSKGFDVWKRGDQPLLKPICQDLDISMHGTPGGVLHVSSLCLHPQRPGSLSLPAADSSTSEPQGQAAGFQLRRMAWFFVARSYLNSGGQATAPLLFQ